MSTIIKKIILTLFISSFYLSFAQEKKERTFMTIYIDLKDESLESYNINKDSCNVHFSIYIEKYESKKERDKAIQKYKNRIGDPDSVGLPSFSFAFYAFNQKPERIKSLDGIKYITIKICLLN